MRLIDADELINFFYCEISGTDEYIQSLVDKHQLTYENDVNEGEVIDLCNDFLEGIKNVINTQLTINEWIPISEKLPDDEKLVLITDGESIYLARRDKDIELWNCGDCGCAYEDIIAWMPIEPYIKNHEI